MNDLSIAFTSEHDVCGLYLDITLRICSNDYASYYLLDVLEGICEHGFMEKGFMTYLRKDFKPTIGTLVVAFGHPSCLRISLRA